MLELSGNSTHLASWHAKLGFVKEPFVATLDSLTADGGRVPAMDLEVIKVGQNNLTLCAEWTTYVVALLFGRRTPSHIWSSRAVRMGLSPRLDRMVRRTS